MYTYFLQRRSVTLRCGSECITRHISQMELAFTNHYYDPCFSGYLNEPNCDPTPCLLNCVRMIFSIRGGVQK
jgi:hypothetical protein